MVSFYALCLQLLIFFVVVGACFPLSSTSAEGGMARETTPGSEAGGAVLSQDSSDLERLALLWHKRAAKAAGADYPIGPGDILEISVPSMEELRSQTVRVSGEGTISLPLLGKIQVGNATEEELKESIRERLRQYMYDPQVITFVKEYRSRQVAVLGAVVKPGLYGLNSGADSILDMISRAGGITSGVDRIYLIPAETVPSDKVGNVTAALPRGFFDKDPAPLILKRNDPILIDIKEMAFGAHQIYLSLPARPGDVIMVPGGGQFLVEGWVEKPGAYNITNGLTVSGAVIAAGGPLFPADTTAVKVIRNEKRGRKTVLVVDLEKIKRGEEPDMALQGGDIIEVSSTDAKLIPYGLYRFFSTIINIGVGANIPLIRK